MIFEEMFFIWESPKGFIFGQVFESGLEKYTIYFENAASSHG